MRSTVVHYRPQNTCESTLKKIKPGTHPLAEAGAAVLVDGAPGVRNCDCDDCCTSCGDWLCC